MMVDLPPQGAPGVPPSAVVPPQAAGPAANAPADNVTSKAAAVEAAEPVRGAARFYLSRLLEDIATMLEFANLRGTAVPDEVRAKITTLLSDREVAEDPAAEKFAKDHAAVVLAKEADARAEAKARADKAEAERAAAEKAAAEKAAAAKAEAVVQAPASVQSAPK